MNVIVRKKARAHWRHAKWCIVDSSVELPANVAELPNQITPHDLGQQVAFDESFFDSKYDFYVKEVL